MSVPGVLAHARDSRRTRPVQVYGVDDRFWRFHGSARGGPTGRTALSGSALAAVLDIRPGDDLLLRLEIPGSTPKESLFGRRSEIARTIRLTCDGILSADELGEFSLQASQRDVLTVFVPLDLLQRGLAQPSRVNTVLIGSTPAPAEPGRVRATLERAFTVQDAGLTVRSLPSHGGVAVESARILLDESQDRAARRGRNGDRPLGCRVCSATSRTRFARTAARFPYSVVAAADLGSGAFTSARWLEDGEAAATTAPDESIWLNEWAARELGARSGVPWRSTITAGTDDGRLSTETARFRLAGIVAIGGDVDAALAPDVAGISKASDIRPGTRPSRWTCAASALRTRMYWHRYRATPKACVTLARGQHLWRSAFRPVVLDPRGRTGIRGAPSTRRPGGRCLVAGSVGRCDAGSMPMRPASRWCR